MFTPCVISNTALDWSISVDQMIDGKTRVAHHTRIKVAVDATSHNKFKFQCNSKGVYIYSVEVTRSLVRLLFY